MELWLHLAEEVVAVVGHHQVYVSPKVLRPLLLPLSLQPVFEPCDFKMTYNSSAS